MILELDLMAMVTGASRPCSDTTMTATCTWNCTWCRRTSGRSSWKRRKRRRNLRATLGVKGWETTYLIQHGFGCLGGLPCSILEGLLQGCSYFCFLINQIVTWRDLSNPSPVVTYFKRGPVLSAKGRIQICQTNHRHPKVLQAVDYGDGVWWLECLGKRQDLEVADGSLSWSTAWILRRFMVKGRGLVAFLRRKLVSPCLSERYMETQRCWSRLLWPLCSTTGFPTRNG